MTYHPYTSNGNCKTLSEVRTDVGTIATAGYKLVRIYGTDCNSVTNVLAAVKERGLRIFITISSLSDVDAQTAIIISATNGDWNNLDTVAVGNELVSTRVSTVSQVIAATNSVRTKLRASGYAGSVVTVDDIATIKSNPTLCTNSDYCAINIQPYYAGIAASTTGTYIKSQVTALQSVVGTTKSIVITEVGWPKQGAAIGSAVPSAASQKVAIAAVKTSFTSSVIFFEAFDSFWAAQAVDRSWGIL